MKAFPVVITLFVVMITAACSQQHTQSLIEPMELPEVIEDPSQYNKLSAEESYVIRQKGTERSFTGAYHNNKKPGIYICKQCNNPLFSSADKFDSGTGWPSFDDVIGESVDEHLDADGRRTEIVCSNCDGHLGHVFRGEGFTTKQTRHCVNSLSLSFVPEQKDTPEKETAGPKNGIYAIADYVKDKGYEDLGKATFAGGCFWCTEAAFERINGVVDVISGYSGGTKTYPTYKEVGGGYTDHAEAIMVYYDPNVVSFDQLLQVFFIAHDPTQLNRQGPDVGRQYRSAIFYHNETQKERSREVIAAIDETGVLPKKVVTELKAYDEFWVAEAYHQDYYEINPGNPYIQNVSKPKVQKVEKVFADILKPEYMK